MYRACFSSLRFAGSASILCPGTKILFVFGFFKPFLKKYLCDGVKNVILFSPMQYVATTKVAGGKLLRVKVQVGDGAIRSAVLTGDFFLHPEDGVLRLEEALLEVARENDIQDFDANVETISERLREVVAREKLELVGFCVEDIAQTFWNAMRSAW